VRYLSPEDMRERGLPPSPGALVRDFNDRFPDLRVSPQAVRKWLGAEAMPDQAKVKALSSWLEVSPQWLRYGDGAGEGHAVRQPLAKYRVVLSERELLRRYRRLRSDQQRALAEIIIALAEANRAD